MVDRIRIIHGFFYELKNEIFLIFFRHFNKLNILDSLETIDYIKRKKCSVSRLGDGEMRLISNSDYSIGFQNNDEILVKRMKEVLSNSDDRLLVCLPIYLIDRTTIKPQYKKMWEQHNRNLYVNFYRQLREFGTEKKFFGNASFTRPYIEAVDKEQSKIIFGKIKSIWDNENILIAEGEQTRLGVGNDLFSNAKSMKRILAPAKNAFSKYDDILQAILNHYSGQLVLLSLGPTATILSADLCKYDVWAIDIGHIDCEYEWFLRGVDDKISLPNKYVNEVPGGNEVTAESDPEYLAQIICTVK